MASKAAQHKSELIERVKALAAARLPAERATALSEFVAQFYANVAVDDLASESADNLYAAALSLWTFATQRPAGAAKVRVYNPRLDEQGWHSSHTVVEMVNDDMPFLVDSLTSALNQRDLTVYLVIHPIVRVLRDRSGNRAVSGKGEEIVRIPHADPHQRTDGARSAGRDQVPARKGAGGRPGGHLRLAPDARPRRGHSGDAG